MRCDTIYCINHCSYEFDDLGYPNPKPSEMYLKKKTRDTAWNELKQKKLTWFEECKKNMVHVLILKRNIR